MSATSLHKSACILCSLNCGIEIEVNPETKEFVKITGDKDHPLSQGYICQKATRLNYYQNHKLRLTTPLRKKADGTFEEVSWEVAIQEIADKLVHIRDTHGGETLAYAGGGGQGNHLGGVYGNALRMALGTPYIYSSLAQEKTGNFWVHGKLFGRQNLVYSEPVDDAEYVLIIGANPMQSHGIAKARNVINDLSRDPNRTLVVVDPRNTETARKADIFLQVKPGHDAWLLAAMIGIIIQEGLENKAFIEEHTAGFEELISHFKNLDVKEYAAIAGVPFEQVYKVAKGIARAKTMVLRSDLGIEMSYNSTLNAYLSRLLFLITGHFGKHGTNHLTTWFFPLLGHSQDPEEGGLTTQVTKMRGIGKLFPPNILPLEIDSDHPKRVRGLIVDSSNPIVTWADTQAQAKAYAKLELMVVIDVAMTETARVAHYVLPASSQFEKYESSFFQENFFHLRRPVVEPLAGTLSEPEIYTRLLQAMGELPTDFSELQEAALQEAAAPGKGIFQQALMVAMSKTKNLNQYMPMVMKEAMKKVLPKGSDAAGMLLLTAQMYAEKYPEAVRNAGFKGSPGEMAFSMFNKILKSPSGIKLSRHDEDSHWDLIKHSDKKVHLAIPELLSWLDNLPAQLEKITALEQDYPFNLIAGERRSYNANTIIRNPEWRKTDPEGALKINPLDADKYRVINDDTVQLTSATGAIQVLVKISDEVPEGILSIPHGHGLVYAEGNDYKQVGARINMLTATTDCDPLAKTPYHKNVRVRLEKVCA